MSKFKVGDKVIVVKRPYNIVPFSKKIDYDCDSVIVGTTDTIKSIDDDSDALLKTEDTYVNTKCLELAEEDEPHYKQYLGKKYAVHCKTQEEWDRVAKVVGRSYFMDADYNKICGDTICLDDNWYLLRSNGEQDYTILSVAEFFGEGETDKNKFERMVDEGISPAGIEHYGHISSHLAEVWKDHGIGISGGFPTDKDINKPNIIKKTMSNVVKFAKDLTLSPNEKEYRKAGFKDSTGQWTEEADDTIMDLESVERDYKDYNDIKRITGQENHLSIFEWDDMYKKHGDALLAIAKAFNKSKD